MKKLIFRTSIVALLLVIFSSCTQDDPIGFTGKQGVYFNATDGTIDSLYYSFLGKIPDVDTIKIPLKVMGNKLVTDQLYKVVIDETKTTAVEGLHYKKLEESYVFPANKFGTDLKLVVNRNDPALLTEDRVIALKLVPTDDFDLGYSNKVNLRVFITNRLIKPSYWDTYLYIYFGDYSKVKHNIAINTQGHDFPLLETDAKSTAKGFGTTYWGIQGRGVCSYIIENEVYDEDGNRIYPWSVL